MPDVCNRLWQVDAYRDGRLGVKDRAAFERHLRSCGECGRRMRAHERLRELGQNLPTDGPSELGLRRLRARVLRDAAHDAAPQALVSRWRGIAVAMTVACLAWWVAVKQHRESARPALAAGAGSVSVGATPDEKAATGTEALAAEVVASAGTQWSQARNDRIERVELDEGTLRVHVRHQVPGERFLVVLPDGELEVRGTTFEVSVEGGATTRVHVDEGVVDLRLRGREALRLVSADEWTASGTPPAPIPAVPPAHAAVSPSASTLPSAPAGDDSASAYASAVALLRAGRNGDAASALHAFVLSAPRSPEAEDASFLEAVALARAGRADAAALAAEDHLASYPRSFHLKEASILVARAAVDRGDCPKARAVLGPWAESAEAARVLQPRCALVP